MSILDALGKMASRFDELEELIVDPDIMGDQVRYTSLLKERGGLLGKVSAFREYEKTCAELTASQEELEVLEDPDERAMFEEEIVNLESSKTSQ